MTKKTRPYRELRAERLANPVVAAAYLNATKKNSPDNFLEALKNVAQARKMTTVAKDAGVQRETLYRSLSEQGNPTWDTLSAVLVAVGLNVIFEPVVVPGVGSPDPSVIVVSEKKVRDTRTNPLEGYDAQTFNSLNPLGGDTNNNYLLQEVLV
ncbi:addiction module antidote protein [Tunturiibacter gelidoferens]|uniref:Addiction module antidote protein n=1 Tax=Tunturiibacter gelidiferens TaxID=3069689 RepID=A0ACC5P1K9_9BACT|nr:addiction module antidote protein [Edaphobacter lichenicola]MBB5340586.1 putative addiction module antidote protein [Edaphobacter lichenicola]